MISVSQERLQVAKVKNIDTVWLYASSFCASVACVH